MMNKGPFPDNPTRCPRCALPLAQCECEPLVSVPVPAEHECFGGCGCMVPARQRTCAECYA
jgi:hypothetical protein